jgi:hypothetical protein
MGRRRTASPIVRDRLKPALRACQTLNLIFLEMADEIAVRCDKSTVVN